MPDNCFFSFPGDLNLVPVPLHLNDPFETVTPAICITAANELQDYLCEHEQKWSHNFGTDNLKPGPVKGKMFGVLVVRNAAGELGYLAAYSGKLADPKADSRFVPSVFDASCDNFFINRGMAELTHINEQLDVLAGSTEIADLETSDQLRLLRRIKSAGLQQKLFDHYLFLNAAKKEASITVIFDRYSTKKPPTAAGECAAPKLLHYAFKNDLKPLAIAEFWWGASPASHQRIHKEFYPACEDKCRTILTYMLGDV
jgi:tRNA pseudouridine32 synthase / 23S rRNA pseudouridine746 synthase